ncbi:MAG: hypothetical protein LH614_04315 [Pyrinomonadaceae bacterium]|nr:hypothetical protein [Pyrinomonadaceae bacterium]
MKNALAKLIFVILFSLVFIVAGTAQTNCEFNSKPAPLLLNLQTGMSPEQAQSVFGKALKIKIKKNGERTFFQNYIKKPAPDVLRGVRALYLRFYDRKLYQIEIFYEPRNDLKTLEEVVNALSAQFNLPVADWQIKDNRAQINCGEIALVADYILNPRIELTDEIVRAAIEKSRKKDKQ